MEYGKIFERSANLVWQHKFLIGLGILASLGSCSGLGGSGTSDGGNGQTPVGPGQFPELGDAISGVALAGIAVVVAIVLVVVLFFWVLGTIARGGMIAGVDAVESGQKPGFSSAWSAGWRRAPTLLGISLLPAIPVVVLIFGLVSVGVVGGFFRAIFEEPSAPPALGGLGAGALLLACIVIPIALVLAILRNFAERASMLEGLGVVDAYRRGAGVLLDNLGDAIVLFLLQIVLFIVLGVLLFIPGIIVIVCCLLWPLLLAAQGAASAFVSTLWTLAWREWTLEPPVEKSPEMI